MKLILTFLALVSSLHAAVETREIEVSFFCLKYVPGLETIHVQKGQTYEPVRLSTANLTNPMKTTLTNGEAVFHRNTPPEKPAADLPLAGKFHVPANIDKALIVLIPNASSDGEAYRSLV